mmetsp:Transcript_51099/g.119652  ORF Transcript_51099/g.119652 Transcript_51099/m.119652 type:complete len:217 (-) Transcript_51099:28-678(-)
MVLLDLEAKGQGDADSPQQSNSAHAHRRSPKQAASPSVSFRKACSKSPKRGAYRAACHKAERSSSTCQSLSPSRHSRSRRAGARAARSECEGFRLGEAAQGHVERRLGADIHEEKVPPPQLESPVVPPPPLRSKAPAAPPLLLTSQAMKADITGLPRSKGKPDVLAPLPLLPAVKQSVRIAPCDTAALHEMCRASEGPQCPLGPMPAAAMRLAAVA